jgi:hypothetical protein
MNAAAPAPNTAPVCHPSYTERFKAFLAVLVLMCVSLGLFVAGTCTAFNVFRNGDTEIKHNFFWTSTEINDGDSYSVRTNFPCKDLNATLRAGRALSIISCALAGILLLMAFVRLLRADLVLGRVSRAAFVSLFVLLVLCGCVVWILAFVAYAKKFCGASFRDVDANDAGPSGPFLVGAWAVALGAFITELLYDGSTESPAPVAANVHDARGSHAIVTYPAAMQPAHTHIAGATQPVGAPPVASY